MNKIHKIACLIGMMVLPMGLAVAAPYGGMGEIVIAGFFMIVFIVFILIPYVGMRLSCWIYGVVKFIFKRKIDKWNMNLIILDIPMFFCAFYFLNEYYIQPKKDRQIRTQAEKLSHITLSQPQTISGITMPAGTKIETNFDYHRTQPEPEKFVYVEFPQEIMWNNIPIIRLKQNLPELKVMSEQRVAIGNWICDKSSGTNGVFWRPITFELLPAYDRKQVLNHENFEQSFYLNHCWLEKGQTVSLPSFQAVVALDSSIRRSEDKLRDVEQGFWRIHANRNDATKAAMKMDFDEFYLVVDSKKTVHNFLIELNDSPEKHCGLPKNTLLGWRKSQPKTILVVTYPTQNVPKTCWGRKLRKVSVDEMRNALPQQNDSSLYMAKQHFEAQSTQP